MLLSTLVLVDKAGKGGRVDLYIELERKTSCILHGRERGRGGAVALFMERRGGAAAFLGARGDSCFLMEGGEEQLQFSCERREGQLHFSRRREEVVACFMGSR